jgi:L,D-peptidoglycan transpeptidase YkuD (ErfK/YbiS/YcfS/YnhG family)
VSKSRSGRRPQVSALSLSASRGWLSFGPFKLPCALGRSGRRARKREGDGGTPIGCWVVRRIYYRPDRVSRPRACCPVLPLRPSDGWCDAVGDRNYNRSIRHPYPAAAERLWREDGLYDVIIVLSYNEVPRVQGLGSAIFMHCAQPGYPPTAGCVAVARAQLLRLVERLPARAGICVRS